MADKPTIIVDFDGVIHSYTSGWKGADVIPDEPVPGAFKFLGNALGHFNVAIFSSRSHQHGGIPAMQQWFKEHGFDPGWALLKFPTEKPPAILSIDDRAFLFEGTFPSMEFIKQFQPWNKKEV